MLGWTSMPRCRGQMRGVDLDAASAPVLTPPIVPVPTLSFLRRSSDRLGSRGGMLQMWVVTSRPLKMGLWYRVSVGDVFLCFF